MEFLPQFMATHLAAMPHRDAQKACRFILDHFPEAPCIPRLTKSTRMFLEGMPCLVVDSEKRRLWFDLTPQREGELLEFYERYEADDLNYFAISREWATGMYAMIKMLQEQRPRQLKLVHIQTPGPVTWGLSVTDDQGKPAFFNETMRDILVKTIIMKAKWQERKVKEMLPGIQTMVTFAEPSLVVHTSAVGSGPRDHIIEALNQVLMNVEGVTCIHCCANIDWTILMDTHTQAINFDAYEYSDKIALYPKELSKFLAKGGLLAWGIVPTANDKIIDESVDNLMHRLENDLQAFADQGIDIQSLIKSSIITPSCVTSNMSVELAERALTLTSELSQRMREKYF
jgi:hypothetical protein